MNFTAPEATVLIVDDNEINLEVAAGLLEPINMKIDLAESGKRALQMAAEKKYHLIFMDHMMPVMDGIETTERLRQMDDEYYHTVPIIALTANALMDAREKFAKAGMDDFVAKPIEMKEICKCIKRWLPEELIILNTENTDASMQGAQRTDATMQARCSRQSGKYTECAAAGSSGYQFGRRRQVFRQ